MSHELSLETAPEVGPPGCWELWPRLGVVGT